MHAMNTAGASGRRWLQFSLRTFLVLLTLLGIWLGRHVELTKRQKRSVAVWRDLGAEIGCRHEMVRAKDGRIYFESRLDPPAPAAVRRWLGDEHFETVVKVQLVTSKQLTEEDFAALTGLPDLQTLEIYARFQLDDETIRQLGALGRLERLVLGNVDGGSDRARISAACLEDLTGLTSLRELFLLDDAFSEADLTKLRRALPKCNIVGQGD